MVSIALYIAVGSGFASVREYFEMNELEFFDAWPLKLMMVLLILNLAVVTWNRIPLTPPRYGVWCIHAGIITLIMGTALYYHFKVEGRTLIPINGTATYFFDNSERALYARVTTQNNVIGMKELPTLPRFSSYGKDSSRLQQPDLSNISKMTLLGSGIQEPTDLSKWLGVNQPVKLDIIGFYPFADIDTQVEQDPLSPDPGVELDIPPSPGMAGSIVLLSTDSSAPLKSFNQNQIEMVARHVQPDSLKNIEDAAHAMFHLTATLPNQPEWEADVEIGKTYPVANTGYQLTVEMFLPSFPMSFTHQPVPVLGLHVVSQSPAPKQDFWRMIVQDIPIQTDFNHDPAVMPRRGLDEPVDKNLVLGYHFMDFAGLMPASGIERHTFLIAGDDQLVDIDATFDHPMGITEFKNNSGQISLSLGDAPAVAVDVHRLDHVALVSRIIETPAAQRSRDLDESGTKQVVAVKVTVGDWSREVDVPFVPFPLPDSTTGQFAQPWSAGTIHIPGSSADLQLQLSNMARNMPAPVTLKSFDFVHYPGWQPGEEGPFRDFVSTLEIQEESGDRTPAVAHLNSPVYYNGGRWIFFQASYDPDGHFSILGVGNRPGIPVMITGFAMIVIGLMYAFYLKPMVIRRMKAKALARVQAGGGKQKQEMVITP